MKIKNVHGMYWDDTQNNWAVVQAATEYETHRDLPTILEWDGIDGQRWVGLNADSDEYYFDGECEPFASVRD